MRKAENVNAPNLSGWVIGAAAGLVAFGVLSLVGKFDLVPAAAIAGGVAAVAGFVLGMPWGANVAAPAVPAHKPVAAQPVATAVPALAAFVSAPAVMPKPSANPKADATPADAAQPAMALGPMRLTASRKGKADDLKEIEGIGPAMEKLVNGMGFFHFDQIAGWSDADVALVDAEMKGFRGRITRDKWVAQAKIIAAEGPGAFRLRAKTNNY